MLHEKGRIVAIEPDAVWVETIQRSTCSSCVAQNGCGQSMLSKLGVKPSYIRVLLQGRDSGLYCVDQEITIGIPNDVVVKYSLLIYLLPLLLLIVFSSIAHTYISSELLSISAGIVGLVVGAIFIRYHAHASRNDPQLQPVLIDDQHVVVVQETR